jgi:hypothetical protein
LLENLIVPHVVNKLPHCMPPDTLGLPSGFFPAGFHTCYMIAHLILLDGILQLVTINITVRRHCKVRAVLVSRQRYCGRRKTCLLIDDAREKTRSERRTVNKREAVSSCVLYHVGP